MTNDRAERWWWLTLGAIALVMFALVPVKLAFLIWLAG